MITQGDTDTVQEKDIHAILPCLVSTFGDQRPSRSEDNFNFTL